MTIPEKKNPSQAKSKYSNFAQLVQGVCQVNEPNLEPTDRLFLNCLAAHTVGGDPHPGNGRLMRACGVGSRQAVNKIEKRVCERHKLAKIVTPGGGHDAGGAGRATVYRIRIEDDRFPYPKPKPLPATLELQDREQETRNSSVAGKNASTRNLEPAYPQLEPVLPATQGPPTRNSRVAPEFKYSNTNTNTSGGKGVTPAAAVNPEIQSQQIENYLTEQLSGYIENCICDCPTLPWIHFLETDKLLATQLAWRGWPFELCDSAMQEKIYARVEAQFGEYLSKPEDFYGYHIAKRPPTGNYVPDDTWLYSRATLLAMDPSEYPREQA
jgi:hypothetical protein